MSYDLNVQWTSAKDPELPRTLAFLAELGYNTVALNYIITGKFPTDLTCQIPDPLPFKVPASLTILRRCTLHLSEPVANSRLASLGGNYDIFAVRPIDEKTLQNACGSLECDIITLDLTQRLGYFFRFKMLSEAIQRGIRHEICYAQGLMGDAAARRNLISNATGLMRATRNRGIIISSEARRAAGCRGLWDVVNLAAVWGLPQDRAYEAVTREARSVVVSGRMKRTGYRGVVDIVYGGEKPAMDGAASTNAVIGKKGNKRKAEDDGSATKAGEQPLSKREKKRRAKVEREQAEKKAD